MITPKDIYQIAESCTTYQSTGEGNLEELDAKIQSLANIKFSTPELEQAAYILSIRARNIGLSHFKEFPQENPLAKLFEIEEVLIEILKEFAPTTKKDIHKFVYKMKSLFQMGTPKLYLKVMSLWIDHTQVSLASLKLPFDEILQITPSLRHVNLTDLRMGCKFSFDQTNMKEKFRELLKSCTNAEHLICTRSLMYHKTIHDIPIPFDQSIFQIFHGITKLKSLDISHCLIDNAETLKHLPPLNKLNIKKIEFEQYKHLSDGNLYFLTDKLLDLSLEVTPYLTNEGLKKIGECTQLKRLNLAFYERIVPLNLSLLQGLTKLDALTISDANQYDDKDFLQLLENMTLRNLTLENCRRVTNAIAPKLKTLKKLQISSGHKVSCEIVIGMTALETLKLKICSPNMHWEHLKEIASLKHLTLSTFHDLSKEEKEAIRNGLPQVKTFIFG